MKLFAKDLKHPRRIIELPNRDILVAEADDAGKSANQIRLLRDLNRDGIADEKYVVLEKFKQPYGIQYKNSKLYVSGVEELRVFDYNLGETKITNKGMNILYLPAGGYNHHWTRNLLFSPGGEHLYISVGSSSNVGEHGLEKEVRRANILRIELDGTNEVVYSSGLRNPVGMDFSPTGELWTVVNERDEIGDNLVPDYLTKVERGDFFGWPFSYFGGHEDPRRKGERPDLVKRAKRPDVALGSHTATLGISFYDKDTFPSKYHGGIFVAQHGSWNRKVLSGYQVLFIPMRGGKPSGDPEPFLQGFISNSKKSEVYGRPVSVETLSDGSLLVSDDDSGRIWHVSYSKESIAKRTEL